MAYIFREKFKISDLAPQAALVKKIMLLDEDEDLLNFYGSLLAQKNFEIVACPSLPEVDGLVRRHRPKALICNLDIFSSPTEFVRLLDSLRKFYPELLCITHTIKFGQNDLRQLMSAGVSGHIERRFSRPSDMVMVVRAALNYNN